MDSLGAAYTQFGFNLFQKLNKIKDGNIFFSPAGISAAIGMLVFGAQGATAAQLQKVRRCPLLSRQTHLWGQPASITLRWGQDTQNACEDKYLDYVEKHYHASLEPVDFVNAADESRKKINSWVESQTKVKDLFPDGSLDSFTKLALVNIVYFKGQWDREFKKENTKEEEFWLNKSTSRCVPMMTQSHAYSFAFLEDLQAKLLGIPYKNNDLSMFVLLPNDTDDLEKVRPCISLALLSFPEALNVTLHLPRFAVEDGYDLEAVLAAVGPGDAVREPRADSPRSASHSGLQAQKFLHRAFVAVTEGGTETAAGTGVGFALTLAPEYEHFHCNHPFLFFVRHNQSNSILFFGRFSSP
uniref:Serpin family B member 13 n=1 Tax=Suricata suricatta TaxID=37032 RepID=A0A673VLD2_SURSU